MASTIDNLLYLTGFEVFRRGTDILMPIEMPVVSPLLLQLVARDVHGDRCL